MKIRYLPLLIGAALASAASAQSLESRSSVATLTVEKGTIPELVRAQIEAYAKGETSAQFPLLPAATDSLRAIAGLKTGVLISWLEPLTWDDSVDAPHFGANNDYLAYFGDGWQEEGAPQWHGDGSAGWLWVNHEYVSGDGPTLSSAPTGQHLVLARYLRNSGVLQNDVNADTWSQADIDTYVQYFKRQVGGSWLRIVKDPASGEWELDRNAKNLRYDATSATQLTIVGQPISAPDRNDATGEKLAAGVVSGTLANCSGGQTPWGTVISGEENAQDYYGDLEACWTGDNAFVAGAGFDPGQPVAPAVETSPGSGMGQISDPNGQKRRDYYSYLSEFDPGAEPADYYQSTLAGGDGAGHRKLGVLGRAHWENATFAVGEDWALAPGQPVVIYAGDDRRSGRIYKFVSSQPYQEGMSEAQARALLDEGRLYVAHFAGLDNATGYSMVGGAAPSSEQPGTGRWIELSVNNDQDVAPNAEALGKPGTTVGEALQDVNWNGIGGFPADGAVRAALFTAANKIGIMELNRPEDVEYNPRDHSGTPTIYVSFTNHTRQVALDQNGVMFDPAQHSEVAPKRDDSVGSIFAMVESDSANPANSREFSYIRVWRGSEGQGVFDAANPDNILIDHLGGVWFGTDGNSGVNGHADAIYYLDLEASHQGSTYGKAFRIAAVPSDAEATGPALSSDMKTLFISVQHPGEDVYSRWPR